MTLSRAAASPGVKTRRYLRASRCTSPDLERIKTLQAWNGEYRYLNAAYLLCTFTIIIALQTSSTTDSTPSTNVTHRCCDNIQTRYLPARYCRYDLAPVPLRARHHDCSTRPASPGRVRGVGRGRASICAGDCAVRSRGILFFCPQ